jgi:hypothetical protein
MRYIWIWILLGIDVIWLISSIVDIVKTVRFVKDHKLYDSVGDFVNCMLEELEESTKSFIILNIFALFIVSLITWMIFKIGVVK